MMAVARPYRRSVHTPDHVRELIEARLRLLEERLGSVAPPIIDDDVAVDVSRDEIERRIQVLRQMVEVLSKGKVDPL